MFPFNVTPNGVCTTMTAVMKVNKKDRQLQGWAHFEPPILSLTYFSTLNNNESATGFLSPLFDEARRAVLHFAQPQDPNA